MVKIAGSLQPPGTQYRTSDYELGDLSSTIYPVNGGLEDWAYGASWDNQDPDAAIPGSSCKPKTYPLEADLNYDDASTVNSMIYIIETDNHKKPPEWTLGGRDVDSEGNIQGVYDVSNSGLNGHVNRNIRLIQTFVEMIEPWI